MHEGIHLFLLYFSKWLTNAPQPKNIKVTTSWTKYIDLKYVKFTRVSEVSRSPPEMWERGKTAHGISLRNVTVTFRLLIHSPLTGASTALTLSTAITAIKCQTLELRVITRSRVKSKWQRLMMESQGSSWQGCVTGKTAFTDEEHANYLLIQIFIACKHNTQSESTACELSITNKH